VIPGFALLMTAALALVAAWPLSACGWVAGALVERVSRAPRLREWVWTAALLLPVVVAAEALVWPGLVSFQAQAPVATLAAKAAPATAAAASAAPSLLMRLLLSPQAVWLAALVVALSVAGLGVRVARLVRAGRRLAAIAERACAPDAAVLERIAARARALDLPLRPIRLSNEVAQPLLVGVRKPVVVLPDTMAGSLDLESLALITAHELAHARRGDNLRLMLVEAALGLFWLTPPMAAVARRMLAAGEERCDAVALAGCAAETRKLYAQTLVDTLRLGAGLEPSTAFIGAGRRPNLMRVNAILEPARPAKRAVVALLTGLGLTALAAASVAAQEAGKTAAGAAAAAGAPEQRGATIIADRVSVSPGDGPMKFQGHVEVKLDPSSFSKTHRKTRRSVIYLIDGRPAPEGFDPDSIKPEAIERLDVTTAKPNGPATINFILKKG
jgi:beta-lactamase regulating signal transducer with metallopeptidase domain